MAVNFILGRSGTGKTRACLDGALDVLRTPDEGRAILLVPEQASFQMERALALRAPGGGYTRAAVLSFSRLAWRIFAETGPTPSLLSAEARSLVLRALVARDDVVLVALRRAARTGGFYAALDQVIGELLHENVAPEAFRAAAEQVDDESTATKVREVAGLYTAYCDWLGTSRTDPAARLATARARLDQVTWLHDASIWIDGFATFSGQELDMLTELAARAKAMTISLLLDPASPAVERPTQPPDALSLFQSTERTYQTLLRRMAAAGIEVVPPTCLQPAVPRRFTKSALAQLERGLATPTKSAANAPAGIGLRRCNTQRDELRAAARWMREKMADSNGTLRFRDFAVIARDLEPLAETVAEVFDEFELPHFVDRRRPLRAHPLCRLIGALFDVARSNFGVAESVQLLRTRLMPLSRAACEQLENVILAESLRTSATWQRATWTLSRGDVTDAFVEQRRQVVAALRPLLDANQGHALQDGRWWARTVYGVLAALEVPAALSRWIDAAREDGRWEAAETHRLAWDALCALLDDVDEVLGETPLSLGDAGAVLASGLSDMTLGLAPPTVDQVLISSIERSRHPDIKYAWVLGLNEGVFPARPADDVLLSTAEREALGQAGLPAPATHREDVLNERLLAYIACTRASHGLMLSFASVRDDGGELQPSPLLDDICRALPGLQVTADDTDAPPTCLGEFAWTYLAARGGAQAARCDVLRQRVVENADTAERLTWLLRGLHYDNEVSAVSGARGPEDAVAWCGSPSEIETFVQCPFQHFAKYRLRLDAQRGPTPVRWDLGDLAHELLARVTRRGMNEPGGVTAVATERWATLLAEELATVSEQWPDDLDQRRPELHVARAQLVRLLQDVLHVHAERWRRGAFAPACCEQVFDGAGDGGALPGWRLVLADGRAVGLRGKIDRVDTCDVDGRTLLLVYDYKSSVDTGSGRFLTGARLQLFAYLAAVRAVWPEDAHARPAGVLLAPVYPALRAVDSKYVAEANKREQTMYLYRPRGWVSATAADRLDALAPGERSAVVAMQRNNDGRYAASSDVVADGELEQWLKLAETTIGQAAAGIVDGCIDIAPLVERRTLACRHCDFRSVCRFERAYNRPRAAEVVLPQLPAGDDE